MIYLKHLESSQTQTNNDSYNHDSDMVNELTDDDKDNANCPLECEELKQRLEDMSANNEHNGSMVMESPDKGYNNEGTADDKLDSSCTPRIEYRLKYLAEVMTANGEVNEKNEDSENKKNVGDKDELEGNTGETNVQNLGEELAENQSANDLDNLKNENSEVIYVIVLESEHDENDEDVAKERKTIKTLPGPINECETQDKGTEYTPITKNISQVAVEFDTSKDNDALRNLESVSGTTPIRIKADNEDEITKFTYNNSEVLEETSQATILQRNDLVIDFEDLIRAHIIIPAHPRELADVKVEIENKESAKPHTTSLCKSFDIPESARNSPEAIKQGCNKSTVDITGIDKTPTTIAEDIKKEIMPPKESENYNIDVTNPFITAPFFSVAKKDEKSSISSSSEKDEDNDGYHSSDFEFITENDAALNGLIVNRPINSSKLDFSDKQEQSRPTNSSSRPLDRHEVTFGNYGSFRQSWNLRNERPDILNQAGPSNSHRLTRRDYHRIANASRRWMDNTSESYLAEDFETLEETRRENHLMPQSNDYVRLFQGMHVPMPTRNMEHKSTHYRTVGGMQIEDNGPGFDADANECYMNLYPEYRPEANRTLNLILDTYPEENMSPRRRRRN